MNTSTNDKVNDFLFDIQSISSEQFDIVISIKEIFLRINNELVEDIKYGGSLIYQMDWLEGFIHTKNIFQSSSATELILLMSSLFWRVAVKKGGT